MYIFLFFILAQIPSTCYRLKTLRATVFSGSNARDSSWDHLFLSLSLLPLLVFSSFLHGVCVRFYVLIRRRFAISVIISVFWFVDFLLWIVVPWREYVRRDRYKTSSSSTIFCLGTISSGGCCAGIDSFLFLQFSIDLSIIRSKFRTLSFSLIFRSTSIIFSLILSTSKHSSARELLASVSSPILSIFQDSIKLVLSTWFLRVARFIVAHFRCSYFPLQSTRNLIELSLWTAR